MNIEKLEDKLSTIHDIHYVSIVELLIEAVRDYPLFGLNDTGQYFNEVRNILDCQEITLEKLENYIDNYQHHGDENAIWIISSLTGLIGAFQLMKIHQIEFSDIVRTINS